MRFFKDLKLGTKINLIVVAMLVIFAITVAQTVRIQVTNGIEKFAAEKANSDLQTTYEMIDNKYPGDWELIDNQLYKGEVLINENFDLVDDIVQLTGGTATVFQGDTRITTTVLLENNERAVGTKASDEVIEAVLRNDEIYNGEANVAGEILQTAYMAIKDSQGEIIGMWYVGTSQELIESTVSQTMMIVYIVTVLMILIAIIGIFMYTKNRIRNRLMRVEAALKKAGKGDFTTSLSDASMDEIGELSISYNQMKESLSNLIQTAAQTSEQVSSSAEELSASSEETSKATGNITEAIQKMAAGAERQANSTEGANKATNDISNSMGQIQEYMDKVKEAALTSGDKSEAGIEVLNNVINQMNLIQEKTNTSSTKVNDLGKKSQEIEKIIALITDVADQTNLLALNAAIEAARAGENGKGFAVVAEEVRKLAEQSGESSGQISQLVKEIQRGIEVSISSMSEGRESVEQGIDLTDQAGRSFAEISNAIEIVISQVEEVSTAITQIASRLEHLVISIDETSEITQSSAANNQSIAAAAEEQNASMEEVASLSEMLRAMADELQDVIQSFKLK